MIEASTEIYKDSKKSLESLLRERAYKQVEEKLKKKGIDINVVVDSDIEALVAAKVSDMHNGIKGFGIGTAFAIAVSLITGL